MDSATSHPDGPDLAAPGSGTKTDPGHDWAYLVDVIHRADGPDIEVFRGKLTGELWLQERPGADQIKVRRNKHGNLCDPLTGVTWDHRDGTRRDPPIAASSQGADGDTQSDNPFAGRTKAPRRQPTKVLADDDLALAFVDAHPQLRYVATWGKWLRWTGQVWAHDKKLAVFSRAREVLRRLAKGNRRRRDMLSGKTVATVEWLSRSDPRAAAAAEEWDLDDLVLNTPDGLCNLRTGKVTPHSPDAHCTKIAAAGPRGLSPRWLRFLREVTNDDVDLMNFLQRVAGYAATGLTVEHALFFCYGTGGNGKGVFLNTLVRLLNDYAVVSPMEVFTESPTDRHPTELARLHMVRMVVVQETEEGKRWAESRIKSLTGGDQIAARFMSKDFFTFQPRFKLLIAGNHKPKLRNVDEAMRRRLHLIPFTVTIPPAQRDPQLTDALQEESAGIMAWIVQGAVEYSRIGLAPPPIVRNATADYFGAQDVFGQWLEDRCEQGALLWEPTGLLFADWKRYAEGLNIRPEDRGKFAEKLESAGFESGKSNAKGGRYWSGLRLIPEATDQGKARF